MTPLVYLTTPELREALCEAACRSSEFIFYQYRGYPFNALMDGPFSIALGDFAPLVEAPLLAYRSETGRSFFLYHPDFNGVCAAASIPYAAPSGLLLPQAGESVKLMTRGRLGPPNFEFKPSGFIACTRLDLLLANAERDLLKACLSPAALISRRNPFTHGL